MLELDASDALRVVLASDLNGGVPIALMLVHVDGLLWLISLDELLFGLLEPVIVLKMQSVLEMDIWQLVTGMILSELEGIVELLLVSLKVNSGFNETILNKELSSTVGAHTFCDLDSNFSKLFLGAI